MRYQVEVEGQGLDMWTYGGDIDAITIRSEMNVWTQGGGGFVSPQYGGYVSPPQVQSRTSQYKEVRLRSDDGSCRTLNAAGHVTCTHGDRLAFVFAKRCDTTEGPLVGIINHTERRWWSFDTNDLIHEPSGRVLKRLLIMLAIGVALVAMSLTHNESSVRSSQEEIAKIDRMISARSKLSYWEFVAQYGANNYFDERGMQNRKAQMLANWDAAGWSNFFVVFVGAPLYLLFIVATQKCRAANFRAKVNAALQREIAVLCEAGDDAAIPQIRSRHPTHLTAAGGSMREVAAL